MTESVKNSPGVVEPRWGHLPGSPPHLTPGAWLLQVPVLYHFPRDLRDWELLYLRKILGPPGSGLYFLDSEIRGSPWRLWFSPDSPCLINTSTNWTSTTSLSMNRTPSVSSFLVSSKMHIWVLLPSLILKSILMHCIAHLVCPLDSQSGDMDSN